MEINDIIERIKTESVEKAEKICQEMIANAKEESAKIIATAEKTSADLINSANNKINLTEKNSITAIKLAGKEVINDIRNTIINLTNLILKKEIETAFSTELISDIILKIINQYLAEEKTDLEIIIHEKNKTILINSLLAKLKPEIIKGITITTNKNIQQGFKIKVTKNNYYEDYTDTALLNILETYLDPHIFTILK